MNSQGFVASRAIRRLKIESDIVVVGGGLTGVCCALSAARRGSKVVLVQDRPVLGGNASSEVRLWALGATSHMGNNNRWSREGGIINEIMTENVYRNKEGNPVVFDTVLLDLVLAESNITLLLNTIVYKVKKSADDLIDHVVAYNPINETRYLINGQFYADCSGDGIVGYLSGAPFRMGSEDKNVYGERFSPDKETYGELLGHTILFYMKDTGKPIKYIAPEFALKDVEKHISKIQNNEYFSIHHHGCKYWWIEYGGRLDTIHDSEHIKHELWKVVYGIWNYIKNSGKFPEMDTYTLEWVGTIPGKRESRRMLGMYTLTQQDIIEQHSHYDAVAYGGWAIDLHPSNGVYADGRACNQWHSKGVYQIPYRCYLGSHIKNLMFGGRIISSSHVANGSTRVMCTSACGGQAVGTALSLCIKNGLTPMDYVNPEKIGELQQALINDGQYIPGIELNNNQNLLHAAEISPSSTFRFSGYKPNGEWQRLTFSTAALFPIKGEMPEIGMSVKATEETTLRIELRKSSRKGGYTPDIILEHINLPIHEGSQEIKFKFESSFAESEYIFVCFMANKHIYIPLSDCLVTGTTTVLNQINLAVSNLGRQDPPEEIGIDSFEFWCPERRPKGKNIAFTLNPPQAIFSKELLSNGYMRPFSSTNAWAPELDDKDPHISLKWDEEQVISNLTLYFDTDFDHAMETVQMGHSEHIMPYCIRKYKVSNADGVILAETDSNYQTINTIKFSNPVKTSRLNIHIDKPEVHTPAALFHIVIK